MKFATAIALTSLLLLCPPAWAMDSLWINGGGSAADVLSASATEYGWIQGTAEGLIGPTENQRYGVMPTSGTVVALRVELSAAPDNGAGTQSYTFTLRLNDDSPAGTLTCAISETATTCTDLVNSLSVVAEDRLTLQIVPSGTPSTPLVRYVMTFRSAAAGESVFTGTGAGTVVSGSTTRFLPLSGTKLGGDAGESPDVELIVPTSGAIENLHIRLETAPGGSETRTFTVRTDATTDTAVTCTITGAETTCNSASLSVAVTAGTTLTISSTTSGSAANSRMSWSAMFVADTDGEFILGATNDDTIASTAAESYSQVTGGDVLSSTTETDLLQLTGTFTAKAIYAKANASPGTGNSYVFTLREEAANTETTCTIADAATTCNGSTASSLTAGNIVTMGINPVSAPSGRALVHSVLGFIQPATARRVYLLN